MSSILTGIGTAPTFIEENADAGLNIIGDRNIENFIQIEENGAPKAGDDVVAGGLAADIIFAADGNDVIIGGDGDDFLDGGAGSDVIRGGAGSDLIRGGEGADIIIGGEGADVFQMDAADFAAGEIDRYLAYEAGVDVLQINGVSEHVSYDAHTGEVKVGDQTVANIGKGLDVDVTQVDDDSFEVF